MAEVEHTSDAIAHAHGAGAEHAHGAGAELEPAAHPHERPEDWGWHHRFGISAQIAGWFCVVALLLMTTATHYNLAGTSALILVAALIAAGLLINARQRRSAWRR